MKKILSFSAVLLMIVGFSINTASVHADGPNDGNNSCTIVTADNSNNGGNGGGGNAGNEASGISTAEIGITKTVDNADPAPGATINYTLTAIASGPATSIGVVASDILPAGVTFVSATSSEGAYNKTTGVWTIGTMNDGAKATLVIKATVNSSDAIGQTITNTGTISESSSVVDENSVNNTSAVTITVGGTPSNGNTNITTSTNTSAGAVLGASTFQFENNLHRGSQGSDVTELQTLLTQEGLYNGPLTDYFGSLTQAAVVAYQTKNGISPTGFVGPLTRAQLNADLNG